MALEEFGDLVGPEELSPTFLEAFGEDGDGVVVGPDDLGEDGSKFGFFGERVGVTALGEFGEGFERVNVVLEDAVDMGVGDNDVGEVAEGEDTSSETTGDELTGEAGRGKKLSGRERWWAKSNQIREGGTGVGER